MLSRFLWAPEEKAMLLFYEQELSTPPSVKGI